MIEPPLLSSFSGTFFSISKKRVIGILTSLCFLHGTVFSEPADRSSPGNTGSRLETENVFPEYPRHEHPAWVSQGLVFAGNWEPLRWRYRKGWSYWGPVHVDEKERYEREHSETTVAALKEFGVNVVLSHAYKGYGLGAEAEDIRSAARFARLLHQYGLRHGSYISCLFIYESFFQEEPDARNWARVNHDGSLQSYGNQGYRYRMFLQHPKAKEYLKKAIRTAIEEIDTDIIFLDTVAQPADNFHPLAEKRFRAFLMKRYPDREAVFSRFGLTDLQGVKIPYYPNYSSFDGIDNPVAQEWVEYRCLEQAEWFREMADYARSLKPDVAVCSNSKGVRTSNTYWNLNIDFPRFVPHGDLIVDEPGDRYYDPSKDRLFSQVPTLKTARRLGLPVFNYTDVHVNPDPRLLLAEALAFNRACLGHVGTPFVPEEIPENAKKYIDFFWEHLDAYRGDPVRPQVAVLRSWPSIAFYNRAPFRELAAAEQELLKKHLLFDIVFDQDMPDLERYDVLVLAGQECLSDAHCLRIESYVADGGGLVFSERSGRLNEIRRRPGTHRLMKLLGGKNRTESPRKQSLGTFGKGRVAYLPRIAGNPGILFSAVLEVLPTTRTFQMEAPPFVLAEYCKSPDGGERFVHLVNYNHRNVSPVTDVRVRLTLPPNAVCREIVLHSPDTPDPSTVPFDRQGREISFEVPELRVYTLARIRLE